MLLKEFLDKHAIQGISHTMLKKIFRFDAPGYSYKVLTIGVIGISMPDNEKKFLKCVKEYYTTDPSGKKLTFRPHESPYSNCAETRRGLFGQTEDTANYDCDSCHLKCLFSLDDKVLYRVNKRNAKKILRKDKGSRLP